MSCLQTRFVKYYVKIIIIALKLLKEYKHSTETLEKKKLTVRVLCCKNTKTMV